MLLENLKSVKTHTPQEIADKHDVELSAVKTQLKKGIAVEKEHSTDPKVAREIALDHLWELPDYYEKLAKVEEDTDKSCWKGYEKRGTKMKGGKRVNNCVKVEK